MIVMIIKLKNPEERSKQHQANENSRNKKRITENIIVIILSTINSAIGYKKNCD